jgi:hypothetical protein
MPHGTEGAGYVPVRGSWTFTGPRFSKNGKPKHEHVAYLGDITESAVERLPQRCYFWDGVTECLDKLCGRISPDERLRIESAIAERVPLPTGAEFKRTVESAATLWSDPVDQLRVLESSCQAARKRWPS